jgi:methylglutaconyl-CoA hydratase
MPRKKSPAIATESASPAYGTLTVARRHGVALVGLNRPDVHNAFDETLIAEITACLTALDTDPTVRAVVLYGEGKSFCAGADLGWMRRMANYSYDENIADAGALARMLHTLHRLSKPTVACVQGAAYGGGVGLIACCDIAIASTAATFAFSEAKLGLIPATIGPYVVQAIGARYAHRYFLTGERFDAAEAYRIGLVHDIAPPDELDAKVNEMLGTLLVAGPNAQAAAKALIRSVANRPIDEKVMADTAERIAFARASDEGKEGVSAFLGRRSPAWVPASLRDTGRKPKG